jgi:hypothetical protein
MKDYGEIGVKRFTFKRGETSYEILAGNVPASMVLNIPAGTKLIMVRHPFQGIGLFPAGITLNEVKGQFPVEAEQAQELALILAEILYELQSV